MSETSQFTDNAEQQSVDSIIAKYLQSLTEGVAQMPTLRNEHLVNLSKFVTVDQVPLTTDDLDTAITIANGTNDDFYVPVVRGRSIELVIMTLHQTSAGSIEEFYVNSALQYLANRPAGPQV